MGLFNTLHAAITCPVCGYTGIFPIQYKYGHTRQLSKVIGQTIEWLGQDREDRGNDVGSPEYRSVTVEAIAGTCPKCQERYLECDVLIEDDTIISARSVGVKREFESPRGYRVNEAK
jgi:hypothetical protein